MNGMKDMPKLNEVHVDNSPEPKPVPYRPLAEFSTVAVLLWSRYFLGCFGAPNPVVSTWWGWGIMVVCLIAFAMIAEKTAKRYGWAERWDYRFWLSTTIVLIMMLLTTKWPGV